MNATPELHDVAHANDVIARHPDIPLTEILGHQYKNWTPEAKQHINNLIAQSTVDGAPAITSASEPVASDSVTIQSFVDPLPKVPQRLKEKSNWVLWKLAQVNGKITKVPYKLDFKNAAASTRSDEWSDYKSVVEKIMSEGGITEKQGLGRVVQKDERVVGFDLDGCRDSQTGAIAQWAEDIVEAVNSYCEITPSQTGIRVWAVGDLPLGDRVFNLDPAVGYGGKVKIEIFTDGRYFTVTGQSIYDAPLVERDLTEAYELIHAIRRKHPAPKKSKTSAATANATATESASVQIEKLGQFDTSKYDIFMRGEITSREPFVIQNGLGKLEYPSQSEADFALATVLAYHHKGDREKMGVDFRASKLYRPEKWDRLEESTFDKVLASVDLTESTPAPLAAVPERTITHEEIDASIEEEFPVYPLGEQSGPLWEDEWMHGIAGEIVRKAGKHCEAHPAGMYLDLIVSLGNIMGRHAHFKVGASKHFTNEFMIRVGNTSTARKGTGRDAINEPLRVVDGNWYTTRVMSGFGSGEAIVGLIADSMQQLVRDTKVSTGFKNIVKPGVDDKRLFIREGEAASIFQLANKKESRADIILRDGWDGLPLKNLVKGKTDGVSNSASCQEPHLSISGDTTRDELKRRMPDGADQNGFGNRFLYAFVYRVKMCPNGGPQLDWTNEVVQLHKAIQFSRSIGYVPLTKAAHKMWSRMYVEIENEVGELPALPQAMCARGVAHVRRLALILALLDMKPAVDSEHLQAAKKLWDYCMESARFIFSGETKEQVQIINWMRLHPGTVTVRQITDEVFHRNRKVEWVKTQLDGLIVAGRLAVAGDQYSVR
jgi:Protein of unknown function (DUF3987)